MGRARALYEEWNRGAVDAMVADFWAPDIVWHDFPEVPDSQVYRGADAVAGYCRSVMETFGHFEMVVDALRPVDDRVLAELRMVGRGQSSGVAVGGQIFHVLTLRNDRVVEVRAFFDQASAREAAGLPNVGDAPP